MPVKVLEIWNEVYDFLTSTPTPQQILAFRPSSHAQERLRDLLEANSDRAAWLRRFRRFLVENRETAHFPLFCILDSYELSRDAVLHVHGHAACLRPSTGDGPHAACPATGTVYATPVPGGLHHAYAWAA